MQNNNENIYLWHGDCIELMKNIDDSSIDMVLCDLPYGVLNKTNPNAKWDAIIPFDKLWEQYLRITKDNSAIVLFGSGMFTSDLMQSQRKLWRYNLIWDKVQKTGFLNSKKMPLRQHEDICVFYKRLPVYNPQMVKSKPHRRNHGRGSCSEMPTNNCYGNFDNLPPEISDEFYPTSIITIGKENFKESYHPTQKPVALLEYLINTYTNRGGGLVLDNCCGSGSTGVACINTDRRFIGIELDDKYYNIAKKRLGLNDGLQTCNDN